MSIGICEVACTKDLDIEEVLEQADKKLYIEKKAKKEKQKKHKIILYTFYAL